MYHRALVAVDFSPASNAALAQAVRVAALAKCPLVLAHVLTDIRHAMLAASRREPLFGDAEKFQRALRKESDGKLKALAASLKSTGVKPTYETLLGAPFVELTHAVQKEVYDLVVAGTHGKSKLKQLVLGSTTARLVQNCPAAVWVARQGGDKPPKTVFVPVDFSDVSARALQHGVWHARQQGAQLHVMHVIDALDVPSDLLERVDKNREPGSFRQQIKQAAKERLAEFLKANMPGDAQATLHVTWGEAWQEICRLAEKLSVDLVTMGTVGRSGWKGLLIGNTAEKVLGRCDCNVLAVKPANYVSPIDPPFWELHPEGEGANPKAAKKA